MDFEQVVKGFQQRLLEAKHLQPFLKEQPFVIVLEAEDMIYTLSLSNLDIKVMKDSFEETQVNVMIQAGKAVFEKLLNGEDHLQKLAKRNELVLQGNYQAILKAETVFYLNNL